VCPLAGEIVLPLSLERCDHETEIIVRLDKDLFNADASQVLDAISHYGIALDLTLREKQTELKQQGYSWDLAKSFPNACPIAPLMPFDGQSLDNMTFSLTINGEVRQQGNTADMLFSIVDLVVFISRNIPLMAGDMILTGTPEGVGPLNDQDKLELSLNGETQAQATIVRS
jgi:2-keto-4-pentenoate hydratase/2-oxohepta-3-ene-1,7-dioic acid hydratase in catechol pathway